MALIVLAVLLAVATPMQACAQKADDLAALRDQVRQLHSQGKYTEAIPLTERYVLLARKRHGEEHTEFSTALAWLGFLYRAQGRYAEAEPLMKRALAIAEKALGPDHPDVAESLNNLAALYLRQGRYTEAEPLYKRALAIKEKALSQEHPSPRIVLSSLQGAGRPWEAGSGLFACNSVAEGRLVDQPIFGVLQRLSSSPCT